MSFEPFINDTLACYLLNNFVCGLPIKLNDSIENWIEIIITNKYNTL